MWALPTPDRWNKYGLYSNNYNTDGIIVTGVKVQFICILRRLLFLFIGTELIGHQTGAQVGLIPYPSSCNVVSIFFIQHSWMPDTAFFQEMCCL